MEYPIRTPRQLAPVLRGQRKSMGKTQNQVGSQVGLLPKTVSALETNPERSSLESLFKLIAALELELVLRPKGGNRLASKLDW